MQRIIPLRTDCQQASAEQLVEAWKQALQEEDRSPGTVKKYIQTLKQFLAWYEQQEHTPLHISVLTPIALIGYRNELQHEQHLSTNTINLRISVLRVWCAWLTNQGYIATDPAARVKLVSGRE
jgi:site-specific recombinase XerC